jgi:hypothetical protein
MEMKRKSYRIYGNALCFIVIGTAVTIVSFVLPVGTAFVVVQNNQQHGIQRGVVLRRNKNNHISILPPYPSSNTIHKRVLSSYDYEHVSVLSMASDVVSPTTSPLQEDHDDDGSPSSCTSSDAIEDRAPLFESFGRGVIRDFRMRLPFYKSDITDGFNVQVRGE